MVIPTKDGSVSSFDPALWTWVKPKCFVYGGGVFGIAQKTELTFREWASLHLQRDELMYEGGVDWDTPEPDCGDPAEDLNYG